MCHLPEHNFPPQCFIYSYSSVRRFLFCAFFGHSSFSTRMANKKRISTVVEMEASCWINSIMIPAIAFRSRCILHKREPSEIRWHRIVWKLFFINCIIFVIFTQRKKRETIHREKNGLLLCPIGGESRGRERKRRVLSWKSIESLPIITVETCTEKAENIVENLLFHRIDTQKRDDDEQKNFSPSHSSCPPLYCAALGEALITVYETII